MIFPAGDENVVVFSPACENIFYFERSKIMKKNRKQNQQKRMQRKRMRRKKRRKKTDQIRWITDDMFALQLDDEDINRLFSSITISEIGPDEDVDFPGGKISLS